MPMGMNQIPLDNSFVPSPRTYVYAYIHTKACTCLVIVTSSIIAKHWKVPKCHSVGEWLNKLCYIHIMECNSAMKWTVYCYTWQTEYGELCWMKKKRSISKCYTLYDSTHIYYWNDKITEMETKVVVTSG